MEGDLGWHYGGDGYNNWDLDAVVRLGGGGRAAITPPYDDPFFALPPPRQDVLPHANVWQQQAMDMPAMAHQADPATAGLDDFLTQILGAPQPSSPTNEVPPQQGAAANSPPAVDKPDSSRGGGSSRPKKTLMRSRRSMKNTENMAVITVPVAEFASADVWSWRKYGQKLIKGSPYPRGYYRCSTDKACPARKMVERCISEPGSLIVTYTDEHNHALPRVRNALAGTMRSNPEAPPLRGPAEVVGGPAQAAAPPPVSAVSAAISFPPTPPRSLYPNVFDEEDDDNAVAVKFLIDDAATAPENAFLFLKPDGAPPAPVHGGKNMAMGAADRGNDGQLFPFPLPEEVGTCSLDGEGNRGGTVSGAGGARAPISNVVMDTFFVSAWESAAGVAAGRRGM